MYIYICLWISVPLTSLTKMKAFGAPHRSADVPLFCIESFRRATFLPADSQDKSFHVLIPRRRPGKLRLTASVLTLTPTRFWEPSHTRPQRSRIYNTYLPYKSALKTKHLLWICGLKPTVGSSQFPIQHPCMSKGICRDAFKSWFKVQFCYFMYIL